MLVDIDSEMESKKVESLIVFGDSTNGNPDLCYVVGCSLARGGIYIKRRGRDPTLVVSNIDVGSAKQGRVRNIRTYTDYGLEKISSKYERNEARVRFYEKLVQAEGLKEPIVLAGRNDVSNTIHLADSLRRRGVKVVGEKSPSILETVRETKDNWEIEKLRDMGRKTGWIVEKTLEFLGKLDVKGTKVVHKGSELKVGTVRRLIGRLLADKGMIAPEDTIFAPGKGSSDPHYRGEDADPVKAGQPIVYDIFPQEPDGYFHDCTRTYTFGRPSRKVRDMYDAVLEAQTVALEHAKEGASCRDLMLRVCKTFETRGYPTVRQLTSGKKKASGDGTSRGFIHGLGHGVGLTIGERPYLSIFAGEKDVLRRSAAVTIEPGLYDPRHGGVRIEDIVIVGTPSENITPLPKDMEL